MPGLVDLHYHTALGRGWADHMPLAREPRSGSGIRWFARSIPRPCTGGRCSATRSRYSFGVTTVNDMYRHIDAMAKAAIRDRDPRGAVERRRRRRARARHLAINEAGFRAAHGAADGRVEVRVGIEWLPLSSIGLLRDASALAEDLGTGVHIHLNESIGEVQISMEKFGRRPTEVAFECGLLGPETVAAHCVWLSDTEIGLMRETGTQISHNPMSNAKLGVGVARLLDYRAAGINVGLGHDSTEGVNSSDLFEVMQFASLVQRAVRMDADLLHAADLLPDGDPQRIARRSGHDAGILAEGEEGRPDRDRPATTRVHAARARQPEPALFPPRLRGPGPTRCARSSSTGTW